MAKRVNCKHCDKSVRVNRDGRLAAHGFIREQGVARLDKMCKGSYQPAFGVDVQPSEIKPCAECALPVEVLVKDAKKIILCAGCFAKKMGVELNPNEAAVLREVEKKKR